MLQEIQDLRQEGDALFATLQTMDESRWQSKTQFQDWTIHDVILHLHYSDYLALTTARDKAAFSKYWVSC
ncbi:MAG: maleylpyruvate isomerase N-terminal domain-containing protein [Myxococcales bacterium]|nr:maleylpyruvate isomerase N-terminal domain-containing protein [Myxococcales bacterium]